jgi:flavin reductase (DIM6/NTAB) family NADH-FMN oxidoreductase RutF
MSDIEKFYYLFPQTVAVIGVGRNLMPAAWHTPVSAKPPLHGVLISPKRFTFELLKKERGFTVNFLMHEHAPIIAKLGSTSGRDIDKIKKFDIATQDARQVNGVIMQSSYAAYECEKSDMHEYGDHFLVVGRIILIHVSQNILKEDDIIDEKNASPVLYFGKDRYLTINPDSLSIFKRD